MAERSKKKTEATEKEESVEKTLEQLILDKKVGKYLVVPFISFWAKELRKMEKHRHLTQSEILELAMTEVLSGKISEKELAARMLAAESNGQAHTSDQDQKK